MKPSRIAGLAVLALLIRTAASPAAPTEPRPPTVQSRLSQRFSLDISSRSLKEALAVIEQAAGVKLQPLWSDDKHATGLDPQANVELHAEQETVVTILERLLEPLDDAPTWQLTPSGAIQLGPRARLNDYKRVEVYDVSDLLKIVPDHRRGPTIDLQQAIQSSGVPLRDSETASQWIDELPQTIERAETLADLIRDLVETDQWKENGGDSGTIRIHQNTLIINAPGYIHRALSAPADGR